jgi:ATP synthase protein I
VLPERRAIDPEAKKMWRLAGNTGAVGIEVAVAIAIGYFAGNYLDRKLGTQPWIMYAGILAGIGAAIKALVRVTRAYRRDVGDQDDREGAGKGSSNEGPGAGKN